MNRLTKNGIQECFRLEVGGTKVILNVDITLQVISLRASDKEEKKVITCVLSDSNYKYGCFIFLKEQTIKNFDIITLKQITHQIMSDKENHAFVVKKFDIVNQNITAVIGNPQQIKINQKQSIIPQPGQNDKDLKARDSRGGENYMPLSNLSTFSQNFTILVRVTKKMHELKLYTNQKGNGKIFSFNIMDMENNEMQVTCFNEVADKYFNEIQENAVYEIKNAQVKIADKKFSSLKADYRLYLDSNSSVIEQEDTGAIKNICYDFKTIESLAELPINCLVDVICFVLEDNEKTSIKTKNGDMAIKRIKIADSSESQIDVTLWRSHSDRDDLKVGSVVAFKSLRIGDYNGKNLGSIDDTVILVDPEIPEATEIRTFYNNFKGRYKTLPNSGQRTSYNLNSTSANLKTVCEAFDKYDDNSMPFFKTKCYIVGFKNDEKNSYPGCPACKKKLTEDNYGYLCPNEACNKKTDKPTYYYSFSVRIKDHSYEYYCDVFGAIGEKIVGMSAEEFRSLQNENDPEKIEKMIQDIEHKQYYFIIKPKNQNYNGQIKKRLSCTKCETIELNQEIKRSLGDLLPYLDKI